jgi:glycosyl transferase family 9 (putative heptosyltransferase)
VLLLRRAVFGLRLAGHRVGLLAPSAAGSALVGAGPGEAQQLLPWESAFTAALFTGDLASPLRDRLAAFDGAVAYTRSADLAHNLGRVIPRAFSHDPTPPPGAGHASRWLARPLSSLGARCGDEEPPTLVATSAENEEAAALRRDLPDRFLAIHPGSGSAAKSWPSDRFGRLVGGLDAGPFLLIEGPADAEAAAALRGGSGAVRARGMRPRALGALLAGAAAFVGNDSGVTHLAAAWGAPTVALFGPTDPGVWSPVGPRVTIVRSPSNRMDGIAVDAVMAAVAPLLAADRRGS